MAAFKWYVDGYSGRERFKTAVNILTHPSTDRNNWNQLDRADRISLHIVCSIRLDEKFLRGLFLMLCFSLYSYVFFILNFVVKRVSCLIF